MLDFQTSADVAKAEQEGEVVYYGHDSEQGIVAILDAFKKDFPKIKTSYVRLQTGALYAKITAERSAGRFGVDVLQLSDISPAVDFQKKGGWEQYASPEYSAYKAEYQSTPAGYFGVPGVGFAGICYNRTKVKPEQAPKTWKDILNPAFKDGISAKLATSGMQHSQWYMLRKLYGNDFGRSSPSSGRRASTRAPSSSTGSPRATIACARWPSMPGTRSTRKGRGYRLWRRPRASPAIAIYVGVVNKRRIQRRPSLFMDWALSRRGQAVYQNQKIRSTGRYETTRGRCPRASAYPTSSFSFPPTGTTTWRAIRCS